MREAVFIYSHITSVDRSKNGLLSTSINKLKTVLERQSSGSPISSTAKGGEGQGLPATDCRGCEGSGCRSVTLLLSAAGLGWRQLLDPARGQNEQGYAPWLWWLRICCPGSHWSLQLHQAIMDVLQLAGIFIKTTGFYQKMAVHQIQQALNHQSSFDWTSKKKKTDSFQDLPHSSLVFWAAQLPRTHTSTAPQGC